MTQYSLGLVLSGFCLTVAACSGGGGSSDADAGARSASGANSAVTTLSEPATIHPELWPALTPLALDPAIEARIDELLGQMTLEQKVGQTIQADSGSVTPQEVRDYRLGSVLSGGNSAPGPLPYADTQSWLDAADAHYAASVDPTGVEVAIPIIWGIDAVHGHANLTGATIFPHNIGLGAARNPELIEEIARVTARELSVSGHDWTFAPTLAAPRDDRWGRTYEGFSESPDIIASYSASIVDGLQGRYGTDGFMAEGRVISAAKHFLADGGTENGADQGDALISEIELRDIHAAGYIPALGAGVQSVMASFSSWQGIKMTGNRALLTDVLKDRMGFQGFVVSDWNAHGQVPGCTNTDCAAAFNAGIDMFMAPDTWKGLYESTLQHVKDGNITEQRLDDAVRRILRVKLASGVFEKGAPSTRALAGDTSLLGSAAHEEVARRAVRESLVLLKNNKQTLPLDASATILVVGDGADSIAKASGGWTLSWQGGTHTNDEFPNAQTILDGIREQVSAAGGTVIFDADGTSTVDADVVIAVYGEDAYAEFQGDRSHLDFVPNGFDTERLSAFKARNIPVVSVFLSGRPMWVNPELNASDAFVAAWLPGSEGGGIADMLFHADQSYEFTGRLPFSWPKSADQTNLNVGDADYDPLFAYGYGLSLESNETLGTLSEESGLGADAGASTDVFFTAGQLAKPWSLFATIDDGDLRVSEIPFDGGGLAVTKVDHKAQEDALKISFATPSSSLRISAFSAVDMSRQSNASMELAFYTRADSPASLQIGMGCGDTGTCEAAFMPLQIDGNDWTEHRINLTCFDRAGVDMTNIGDAIIIRSGAQTDIAIADIRLLSDTDATETCGTTQ